MMIICVNITGKRRNNCHRFCIYSNFNIYCTTLVVKMHFSFIDIIRHPILHIRTLSLQAIDLMTSPFQ